MTNANEVSVLFICSSPKKYRLVVKQLAQDGWAVSAVGNVKKGLQIMMQKKPTHVFISANTPGIALLKIAKIVTSTFKIPVILFAESQDYQTSKMMRETRWQHTLSSGLSAVAVRNKIRSLSGADTNLATDASSSMKRFSMGNNSKENDNGIIRIEGNIGKSINIKEGSPTSRKSSDGDLHEEASDAGSSALNSKGAHNTDKEDLDGGFYYQGKKVKQVVEEKSDDDDDLLDGDILSEDIIDELDVSGDSNGDNDEISKLLGAFDESGEMIAEADELSFDKDNKSAGAQRKTKFHDIDSTIDDDNELSIESNQQNKKNADGQAGLKSKNNSNKSSNEDDDVVAGDHVTNVVPFNKKSKKKINSSKIKESELNDDIDFANDVLGIDINAAEESKLSKKILSEIEGIVEKSLNHVVNSNEQVQSKVDKTSDFVAFFVNSKEFSGLIYMAVGKNNAISSGIIGSFMKTLSENFKASSIEAYVHRPVSISVKPVNISEWMDEKCDFKLVTSHLENEVVLGFIADNHAHPLFDESPHDGMFHVDVKHFPVNYTMNMDLFVYLPLNKKAIKYIGKGGYLDKKQKHRLLKNEISAFHILNEEILTVRDFFVKLYTKSKLAS